MSSHVVVIATDLRRATVKVSPGTYLVDVLQEACQKLNLASDRHVLRYKQKLVDLAVPLRASGLVPGAKLELVQRENTPSAVQIALQVPHPEAREIPGGRLIRKFPSDLTLWRVLRQFESGESSAGKNVNITVRSVATASQGGGQLYYEMPVLNIMGRELSSFADFQKTLSQLGHNSGNVLVRLSYRTMQQTLFEAMEQISQFFNAADDHGHEGPHSVMPGSQPQPNDLGKPQDTPMADAAPAPAAPPENSSSGAPQHPAPQAQNPVSDEIETLAQQPPPPPTGQQQPREASSGKDEPAASGDAYRTVNIFLAPTGATPSAALAPADEHDFAPTIAQAQLHQARLQESSRNKCLLSDKELEDKAAADEARVAAISSVLVKVRFPDNTSGEWLVGPHHTGAFLHEAVRRVMASRRHPFRLVLPGSRTVIEDDAAPRHALIRGYRLSGRLLVNLVWDDDVGPEARRLPFLRPDVAQRGQAVRVPEVPRAQDDGEPAPAPPSQPSLSGRGEAGGGARGEDAQVAKLGKK